MVGVTMGDSGDTGPGLRSRNGGLAHGGVISKGLVAGVKPNTGLHVLTKDELRGWIQSRSIVIALGNKQKSKDDLIKFIRNAPPDQQPTEDQVDAIIAERKARKAAQKAGNSKVVNVADGGPGHPS
ncbi:hypothetical protein BYT27DRAFT_7238154 [Phlegmacium glaucopus]|nr:hypothetical protein BYT27DRAFT_7238154 [Phlegmacium glaucopus]